MRHLMFHRTFASSILAMAAVVISFVPAAPGQAQAAADRKFLYLMTNNISEGQNSIAAYTRMADGRLAPHPKSPFLTGGTGIDNSTNGKLGPNDNDTPLIASADNRLLFAVNGHSNTIAVMRIEDDGSLSQVEGSPFHSMGVGPVSLAISGNMLLVANRNEDPHQLSDLRGGAFANYASFRIAEDGGLSFVSKIDLTDGQKPTQILVSSRNPAIAFGNDFQVDADFDGDGPVSRLFGATQQVRGRIHAFRVNPKKGLEQVEVEELVETVQPAPDVPSVPLGIWDHPSQNLLYAGLVTRNQLGVWQYDPRGKLTFIGAVPNSGQDICWLRTNRSGTRLYAVNNLPREDRMDAAGTVTVFDISAERARQPVEISRIELPMPLGTFTNNRAGTQPNSTPFQLTLDADGAHLYVINQRINQTPQSEQRLGNVLHVLAVAEDGTLSMVASRHLDGDGVDYRARPQGIVSADLGGARLSKK